MGQVSGKLFGRVAWMSGGRSHETYAGTSCGLISEAAWTTSPGGRRGSAVSCLAIRCRMSPSKGGNPDRGRLRVAATEVGKSNDHQSSDSARPRDSASRRLASWLASMKSTRRAPGNPSVDGGEVHKEYALCVDELSGGACCDRGADLGQLSAIRCYAPCH